MRTAHPKLPGSVNAYLTSDFAFNGTQGKYNGTTKDLACKLVARGARAGDKFSAAIGGTNWRDGVVVPAPGDTRAGGLWARY